MAENKMEQVDFWIRFFKEHINTIGCVELDGLDCREVLALLQELADKKMNKPNKMEAVAQLFGKKLGEEFKILYKDENYTAYFRNEGLRVRGLFCLTWDNAFVALLRGEAVIVNE